MRRNLMNEKLVWMSNGDFNLILRAVNLAGLMVQDAKDRGLVFHDLDGDPVTPERLEEGIAAINEAHFALGRAKYVPETVIDKLRLVLLSD